MMKKISYYVTIFKEFIKKEKQIKKSRKQIDKIRNNKQENNLKNK